MTADAIMTVAAAVVALTQLVKWSGAIQDRQGPLVVLVLALLGVLMWGFSFEVNITRQLLWPYFAAWITVATSAAGVFGFVRAAVDQVTATRTA